MPEPTFDEPLDLSQMFEPSSPGTLGSAPVPMVVEPTEIVDMPALPPVRLVDVNTLPAPMAEAARRQALTIDLTRSDEVSSILGTIMAPVSIISREMLTNTNIGDMGEVGRVAAAVIDGIKILRIKEIQEEALKVSPKATGFMSKLIGMTHIAHSAIESFSENRKQFLAVMNAQEARARTTVGDLKVTMKQLDKQLAVIRHNVSDLTISIAACQIALSDGEARYEQLRETAIKSQNPGDAALALDYRGRVTNFAGVIRDMRQGMLLAATLVPIISDNRKSAETMANKLETGLLLTFPRLMALASQAVATAKINRAHEEGGKMAEANRQLGVLAAKGSHDAAVAAAESMRTDARDIDTLGMIADQTVETMREVLAIERDIARNEAANETRFVEIKQKLVDGMNRVQRQALEA